MKSLSDGQKVGISKPRVQTDHAKNLILVQQRSEGIDVKLKSNHRCEREEQLPVNIK